MKYLYEKPEGMRFVDLCIWIDAHMYDENPDYDTIYKYLHILAQMLAVKARYFNTEQDYIDFASYLAYATYERIVDPNKIKLKSVLNYMKSVMYFRKNEYERETYSQIIDTNLQKYENFNGDLFKETMRSGCEDYNRGLLELSVMDTLKDIPQIIKSNIPKVYRSDKVKYRNIYISCLLSMISRLTLPNESVRYLDEKLKTATNFNEVNYYRKHLEDDIILWHLPKTMEDVIRVVINKSNSFLVEEIKGLSDDIKISEEEYTNIIRSTYGGYNETDN